MRKNRKMFFVLLFACLLAFSACVPPPDGQGNGDSASYITASVLKKTESGRVYIEADGKPLLYTGAAIRVDGYTHFGEKTFEETEWLFQYAAELGVTTVESQLVWGDIEKTKDAYDFRQLRKMLEWAKKYGLRMELIWVTPQECTWYLPDYIYQDEETYPKYQTDHKGAYWWNGYHGTMVYGHENLIERERKCITAIAEFLYQWEVNNGNPNIVVGFLVNNEPDGFPRYTINEQKAYLPDGSRRLLDKEAWTALYTTLGEESKAFKESKYRALTRVNLIKLWDNADGLDTYAKRIYNIPTIDMIGDDTYTESISSQTKAMHDLMTGTFADNMPHVAENSGAFKNTASLLLSAITQGAGYLIYCLALPKGYVGAPGSEGYDYWEQGLLSVDWEEKEHTQSVKEILHGLNKAGSQMVVADLKDVVAFNLEDNYPRQETEQSFSLGNRTVRYRTDCGGIGYAVRYKGYTTVFATENCTLEFSGSAIEHAEKGYFDGYDFVSEGEVSLNENILALQENTCYRIATN